VAIRKFDARTMAEGMRLVRETVGPDAMILQSLRRNGRVELYVETQVPAPAKAKAEALHVEPLQSKTTQPQASRSAAADQQFSRPQSSVRRQVDTDLGSQRGLDSMASLAPLAVEAPAVRGPTDPLDFSSFDEILQSIRNEVPGDQDASVRTDPITGKANIKAVIERLQLEPTLAAHLAPCRRIDELIESLAAQINVVDESKPPRGIKAFVGPAGSGKTTTLTKLVTRHVMQFGADSIAIVGCDRIRAGAQEQLSKVAVLLQVPFLQVSAKCSLAQALNKLSHCQLIMIDMPGISMRAPELAAELACLDDSGFEIDRYLTLQANLQAEVMQLAVSVYGVKNRTQVILTKLDESCNLGPALDLLATTRLPLAYLTDGPHVPEDLMAARAKPMIQQALALLRGKFAKQPINDLTNRGGTEMVSGL
jgi:flagellar biosynthesis protein FlhF